LKNRAWNAADEDWNVLTGLFPDGWQQEAVRTRVVERLRGFSSADMLLRTLLLHVGNGFSLRETALRAKLASWADVSDVSLLKRLRNSPRKCSSDSHCGRNDCKGTW
jgi:hypothetical protein